MLVFLYISPSSVSPSTASILLHAELRIAGILILRIYAMYDCNKKLLILLFSLMGIELVVESVVVGLSAATVDSMYLLSLFLHASVSTDRIFCSATCTTNPWIRRLQPTQHGHLLLGILVATARTRAHHVLACRKQVDRSASKP